MIIIAKANNASYVTISESPVRMKSHRHQLLSSEFERSKEKLLLSSNEKGATATVVVFLRVLPFGETFSILRRVSGFVKKKRASRVGRGRRVGAPTIGRAKTLRSVSCRPVFRETRKYRCFYICDSYKKSSKRFWKEGTGGAAENSSVNRFQRATSRKTLSSGRRR